MNEQKYWHEKFSPWNGCTKVSPGCDHCYAEKEDKRKRFDTVTHWGTDALRLMQSDTYWEQPHNWNRRAAKTGLPCRIFCGSMCDVMERSDTLDLDSLRDRLYKLIEETPNLTWMFFTKRAQEYTKFLPQSWLENPRPNVWLVTTVESQDYLWRIDELLKVPGVVHGVICEPLLGPIQLPETFLKLRNTGWLITGGESGKRARPAQPDWFRRLRDQCVPAGVPFFFKQWGQHDEKLVKLRSKYDVEALLDGKVWNEYPATASAGAYPDPPTI